MSTQRSIDTPTEFVEPNPVGNGFGGMTHATDVDGVNRIPSMYAAPMIPEPANWTIVSLDIVGAIFDSPNDFQYSS